MIKKIMDWDLIIKGATRVSSADREVVDVAIVDHKIAKIAPKLPDSKAKKILPAAGMSLIPGVIDSQVHFRDPGREHKEDFETGSKAAAMGGVTTILDMPNTHPSTTIPERMEEKFRLAQKKCIVNFGLFVGATGDNVPEINQCLEKDYCHGIKIFLGSSTGDLLLYAPPKLMKILRECPAPIAVHSESEAILQARIGVRDAGSSAHTHPQWRNEASALESTQMIVDLARQAGRKIHVLHISTASEMAFLKQNKDFCTVEVTPQHLTLYAPDCYDRLNTYAQMNPPIRENHHREALWRGIEDGTVDVIGSDHAPHTRQEKETPYPGAPSGMPGVQTLLPLMLDHCHHGRLTLEKLVELICERPAQLYHLEGKGWIKEGYDADLTLIDTRKVHTIADDEQESRCGWTPFAGMKVTGMPVATIVRGKIVMQDLKLTGERSGVPIRTATP